MLAQFMSYLSGAIEAIIFDNDDLEGNVAILRAEYCFYET
jgi:hypothetical protein